MSNYSIDVRAKQRLCHLDYPLNFDKFDCGFASYLMAAFTKRKQALHDLFPGTVVIGNEHLVSIEESLTNR